MKRFIVFIKKQHLKTLAVRSLEAVITIVLVLVFFALFSLLLNGLFPSGAGISEIVNREQSVPPADWNDAMLTEFQRKQGRVKPTAVLTRARNTVKQKGGNEIAWSDAQGGMKLYDRDAVQTLQRSSAYLDFGDQSYLSMGANSLVVIKSRTPDAQAPERKHLILMVEGDLRGKISGSGRKPGQMEITTPRAVAVIHAQQNGGEAEFKVSVNPDKSSTIAVYQGVADVTAGDKTVRVEENSAVTVKLDQSFSVTKPLPSRPELIAPEASGRFLYRTLSPRIVFTWKELPGATRYHFVLARDQAFQDVVLDERISSTEFMHGSLKQGTYYWRASTLVGDIEGPFTVPLQFSVEQKRTPPLLVVNDSPEKVSQESCEFSGHTEPGARVFINGQEVLITPEGEFRHAVALERGINIIVVEAVDAAGNVSYRSSRVQGKF
jgi:mannose-6-phosphate isomerase-like protein (cupin superfamily)